MVWERSRVTVSMYTQHTSKKASHKRQPDLSKIIRMMGESSNDWESANGQEGDI